MSCFTCFILFWVRLGGHIQSPHVHHDSADILNLLCDHDVEWLVERPGLLLQVHHGGHSGRDEAAERVSRGSAGVGVAAAGGNAPLGNDELLLESVQE